MLDDSLFCYFRIFGSGGFSSSRGDTAILGPPGYRAVPRRTRRAGIHSQTHTFEDSRFGPQCEHASRGYRPCMCYQARKMNGLWLVTFETRGSVRTRLFTSWNHWRLRQLQETRDQTCRRFSNPDEGFVHTEGWEEPLFRHRVVHCWTPHSGRNFLPSATGALGHAKQERDALGGCLRKEARGTQGWPDSASQWCRQPSRGRSRPIES